MSYQSTPAMMSYQFNPAVMSYQSFITATTTHTSHRLHPWDEESRARHQTNDTVSSPNLQPWKTFCSKGERTKKTSLTCHVLKYSQDPFPYNIHNSVQAKLTAAVELHITIYAIIGILQKLISNQTQYSESADSAVLSCVSS